MTFSKQRSSDTAYGESYLVFSWVITESGKFGSILGWLMGSPAVLAVKNCSILHKIVDVTSTPAGKSRVSVIVIGEPPHQTLDHKP